MPEITVRAWECDLCGKIVYEKDVYYNDYYRISIEPGNADASDRTDIYYGYVCQTCKDDLCEYIKAVC